MTIRMMVIMMTIMIMVMIMAVLVIRKHDESYQLMHVCGCCLYDGAQCCNVDKTTELMLRIIYPHNVTQQRMNLQEGDTNVICIFIVRILDGYDINGCLRFSTAGHSIESEAESQSNQ